MPDQAKEFMAFVESYDIRTLVPYMPLCLRDWTKLRRIPHHRLGHFVYYDPVEVSTYIRTKLKVPARG